jgi:hypothetical protein
MIFSSTSVIDMIGYHTFHSTTPLQQKYGGILIKLMSCSHRSGIAVICNIIIAIPRQHWHTYAVLDGTSVSQIEISGVLSDIQ